MEAGGAMAEVGLLPFARIALQVSRAVLPRYRSRFSKRQFSQPQLLAILCLMRYEDWTFREAEVRLSEHRELRQVLGLVSVPDFTTLYRFLQRLDDQTIDRAVGETVRRLRGSLRQKRKRARVAVDATGLAQGAVSTFFVRRMHHHGQKPLPWRHWLKWVVAVDLDQQFVLSQLARRGPWNDCANLPTVIDAASEETRIGLVLADAEFDSERNHTYIRKRLGAQSVIPAKRGKKTWRLHGVRAEMRRAFPQRIYRRRSLIESLFSSVKRKLSARAPGRSLPMQMRQALLLGLSFNLYRLKHRRLSLRMPTEPRYLNDKADRDAPRRARLRCGHGNLWLRGRPGRTFVGAGATRWGQRFPVERHGNCGRRAAVQRNGESQRSQPGRHLERLRDGLHGRKLRND
jgi:Transposase DDE domain/Transposase domain (DUF772)